MADFVEHVSFEEVTKAYFCCRRHKRMKASSLQYELNYELNNYILYKELNNGTYKIGKSICFCVTRPKLREVFAADFRDRIVHHLLMNRLLSIFENDFIDSSYSCREGKGVLYGVSDISDKIRKIGKDCWYVQLDVQGFFMSIDKEILWKNVSELIAANWHYGNDMDWWLNLFKLVIFNRPELNCRKKGNVNLFDELPPHKTLFKSNGKGLPIGNLTSQILANAYMNGLDKKLSSLCMGYGRYVDDILMLDTDVYKLKSLIPVCREELKKLGLTLNEKKTKIQRADKGVLFTGYIIQPFGVYVGNSLKKNAMKKCIHETCVQKIISSMNSYFGFMKHALTYNLRRRMWDIISKRFKELTIRKNYKCLSPSKESKEKTDAFPEKLFNGTSD